LALAFVGAAVAASAPAASHDNSDSHEGLRLHAVAVNMSNVGRRGPTPIDIGIERWSTDEEKAQLKRALGEDHQGDLAVALQKMDRLGFIRRSSGGLGWDIHYARRYPLPNGGYRVVIATDRPMSFSERVEAPRSAQYDLTIAEIRIDKNGKGEGALIPAARITFNDDNDVMEVENYASEPIQLNNVEDMSAKSGKSHARTEEKE
jgi:hypothetical protein